MELSEGSRVYGSCGFSDPLSIFAFYDFLLLLFDLSLSSLYLPLSHRLLSLFSSSSSAAFFFFFLIFSCLPKIHDTLTFSLTSEVEPTEK